jgi:phosphatidylglycerophosphatase C
VAENNLAIFDLDGTITRHDTLWPYVRGFLWRHPRRWWRLPLCLGPALLYLAAHRDRGRLKSGVIRLTLGGVARASLARWSEAFTARLLRRGLYGEALLCLEAHRRTGAYLVLLSASPDLYVPVIARALGFDECLCTEVRWRPDGTLDGALASANRRGAEKARCVRSLLEERQPLLSHAYGNSRADLEHLRLVSAGTYVNGRWFQAARYPNVRAVRWRQHGRPVTFAPAATI